ncbi:MAG: hypothetical protein ABIP29_05360, partial [Candidatus Eisenbacteria bacterium]
DAKYALRKREVWSVFMHPMSTLVPDDLGTFIDQVALLVKNTGTTYASSDLVFGVDDDGDARLDVDYEVDVDDDEDEDDDGDDETGDDETGDDADEGDDGDDEVDDDGVVIEKDDHRHGRPTAREVLDLSGLLDTTYDADPDEGDDEDDEDQKRRKKARP